MHNTDVYDEDLNPILDNASNEEVGILHDIVMKKTTEMLSIADAYKRHHPDHKQYADLIAKEIRDFGGNTFVNAFRGEGPTYHEVVRDAAKAIKAPFSKSQDIATIESSILATILEKAFEKMTEEEQLVVLEAVGKSNKSWMGGASAMAFQAIFRAGGFASYQLMLIVVNAVVKGMVGRGLSLAANAAMGRAMSIAVGPVGWAVSTLLALIQIAGPSYKVTLPCVLYVAMLRANQRAVQCTKCGAVLDNSFAFCSQCGTALVGSETADEPEQDTDAGDGGAAHVPAG